MELVRVELLKVRTTRLWIVLLAAVVGVVSLIIVAVLGTSSPDPQAQALHTLKTVSDVRTLIDIGGLSATLALVLGATMSTSEHRYGTAGTTYLATPRRGRVVTAKMLAAVPVGVLFGLVGGCVPLLVALVWFAAKSQSVPLDGSVPLEILMLGLQVVFAAVMGVALGAVLRSQVAAIVGLLVWVLVVESVVGGLFPSVAKWFPFSGAAGAFSSQGRPDHLLARPEAALLMTAYVVAGWAAAVWFERDRDV